jgi:AcrR family transcriptional regulator
MGTMTSPKPRPAGRRRPVQQRSAERLEIILQGARELICESGAESLKMSELAARAGISIGSLYQYFPERSAVVAALAQRYNEHGVECVRETLKNVASAEALRRALCDVVDGYYEIFLTEPVMRDIWAGALADKSLQSIDEEDCRAHAALIRDAMRRAFPKSRKTFEDEAHLLSTLISAVVRYAVVQESESAQRIQTLFKARVIGALLS